MGKSQEARDALLAQLFSPGLFRGVSARLMDRLGLTEYVAERLADKAVEETWRALDEYDPEGRSLQNWVFQRAYWHALDYLKLPRAEAEQDAEAIENVTELLPDPNKDVEAIASQHELEERVLEMLAERPDLLRLYKMRRYWMLSPEKLAENFGISIREAKNLYEQLVRMLKRINAMLEEEMRRK